MNLFAGRGKRMADKQKILLTFTFTEKDEKALAFVLRTFTDREGVSITIFSSYPPLPSEAPDFSKALGSWPAAVGEAIVRNGIAKQIQEYEHRLMEIEQRLVEAGFRKDSIDHIFRESSRDEAEEIIETVREGNYNVIVLAFRPGHVWRIFAKNVYQAVMESLRGVAICIIT